ncbi:hypothetical protein LCGC14_2100890, partial [marine sediment metagenome]
FQPVTVVLETENEVEYVKVLLGIRKGDALKNSQFTSTGYKVASRIEMRDTFNASVS